MSSKIYRILYVIFIIISVLYRYEMITSAVSYRHVISLIMLGVSLFAGYLADKYMWLYLAFLLFFAVSSTITGYVGAFFNKFFGTYLPFIAACSSTYILIKKYQGADLLVWLFVGIGLFDAIITIGQFFRWGFVDQVYSLFSFSLDNDFIESSYQRSDYSGRILVGLFDSVTNGYFLSAVSLLVLCNKKCKFFINVALWAVVIFASFLAQERAGFYLAVIFSVFIFIRYLGQKTGHLGVIVGVIILLFLAVYAADYTGLLLNGDFRYSKGLDMQNRGELRASAWTYFLQNPLGGFYDYIAKGNGHPHIFFLNAFLYGGLLGGIIVIYLLFIQLIKIFPYLFKRIPDNNAEWAFVWGLIYVDYSLISMLHNASIISGTFLFFIWWGAFIAFSDMFTENRQGIAGPVD